jgi:hypothetical protein
MGDAKLKLQEEIKIQGETVRKLKSEKADKDKVRKKVPFRYNPTKQWHVLRVLFKHML